MKYVAVKGTQVPALGFGTWGLSGRSGYDAVRQAIDLGYRHIDTAQMYGNEVEIGKAIRESGLDRDAIFLTTKVQPSNLRAIAVKRSHEESLRRLGVHYVDLLLIHWPNEQVRLGETLDAMEDVRAQGKTRFIGVSNFTVKLLREAVGKHHADLLCNQVEYHPFLSQRRVLAALRGYDMMLTAYAPVARGRVSKDPVLNAIGEKYGKSGGQVALRWLIEQEGVAAVPKAANREHAATNIDIFDFQLAPEDHAAIERLASGNRLVEFPGWSPDWDPV
jgi:2,5-diketo-D-gluconate reductase B